MQIYKFLCAISSNLMVMTQLFSSTKDEALVSFKNFNMIFQNESNESLVKCFGSMSYSVKRDVYEIQEGLVSSIKAYNSYVSQQSLDEIPAKCSIEEIKDLDLTYFGRRNSIGDMSVSFWFRESNIASLGFGVDDITPAVFPKYCANKIKSKYGHNPDLSAMVKKYKAIADLFIAKNSNENDPIKFSFEFKTAEAKLTNIFTGQIEYFPELITLSRKFYDCSRRIRKAMLEEARLTANCKEVSRHGITPLMVAVLRLESHFSRLNIQSHLEKVDELIAAGVDVNARDNCGRSALFYVAFPEIMFDENVLPGRGLMTKKLLDAGADPTIKDVLDKTALDYYRLDGGSPHDGIALLEAAREKVSTSRPRLRYR